MIQDEPVIVLQDLTKIYGDFVALDKLSFTVRRGQILGFIGHNGAGKTTAIKIMVGLSKPTSGTATIAGIDCVKESHKIKRAVGFMPDTFGIYDNMRVREYLDFFGAAFSIGAKERKKRIDEVMETAGVTYMKDKYVESLSHGMKQRVAISRILLHDPEVLILDEPANGLDPKARIEMREIILRLADMGKTIIVTSHILPELSRICNQVAILHRGKLKAFGPLNKVMKHLTQLRTFEVQISSRQHLKPAALIVKNLKMSKGTIVISKHESLVRFKTEKTDQELSGVLAEMVNQGIPVTQFRELQTDLEDAFMSVLKGPDSQNGEADS